MATAEPAGLVDGAMQDTNTIHAALMGGLANLLKGLPLVGACVALVSFSAAWAAQVRLT